MKGLKISFCCRHCHNERICQIVQHCAANFVFLDEATLAQANRAVTCSLKMHLKAMQRSYQQLIEEADIGKQAGYF